MDDLLPLVADLRQQLADAQRWLKEGLAQRDDALAREAALAEVLQAVNSKSGDLSAVFALILEKAHALCGVTYGSLQLYDGTKLRAVAVHSLPEPLASRLRDGYVPGAHFRSLIDGADFAHVPDMAEIDGPMAKVVVEAGVRSLLSVALRKDGKLLGQIVAARIAVQPFSDKEIALLQSFAAQAVIAMENARLLTEQREALEQQTATAEVLQVINASPGDLAPVFEAILARSMTLCGAAFGTFATFDGQRLDTVATRGVPEAFANFRRSHPPAYGPATGPGRLIAGEDLVHEIDVADSEAYRQGDPSRRAIVDLGGARTILNVALRKEKVLLGAMSIYRQEVRPFSDDQVALLRDFAAQAVIAMENARLITETREALERQTATADILKVIASSPADMKPAFDAIAGSAKRLLGGMSTTVWRLEGDAYRLEAFTPTTEEADRALREMSVLPKEQGDTLAPAAAGRTITEIPDTESGPAFMREIARLRGFRACLAVSLAIEGQSIGFVNVTRREPGVFRPEDVELLKTFADQAVIAIENVRLFTELRESLEQQTATGEILRVIAQSPTDVKPVLDAVANAALRFCGANDVQVCLREAEKWFVAVHLGPLGSKVGERRILDRQTGPGRAITDGKTVHLADVQGLDPVEFAEARKLGTALGFNSALCAPMMRDEVAIGGISLRRPQTASFSERQIALLESFAAQAVIAIENVRLFTELRESLDQQAATSDVLKVIASSPTDVQPVLDAVAKAAQRFCGAADAVISLREGDEFVRAAHEGSMPFVLGRSALDRSSISGCAIVDARTTHIPDLGALEANDFAKSQTLAIGSGARAALAAPMLREGVAIGCILLRKTNAGPFAPKQIELLEAFAAQAVIAIENVRLFTELRDSLERLKAAQANLVQSEKMASLGQLTAGIAHEIKNPLNFVNNFAALSVDLLDELKEAAGGALATLDEGRRAEVDETMGLLTGNLAKIAEHGKRADGIVRSMLSHSRGGSGDWAPSDINALVEEALNLAYHGARAQDNEFNVTLERDLDKNSRPIDVVPQDVTRVFLNVFGNGFYAVGKRRKADKQAGFRPTLKVSTRDLGEAVEIRVRDNGTGIPPDVREKLFQPFFTTKPTGEGTGLGLSISYDIVTQEHGGTIEVESEPGSFTEFTVRLPRRRVQTANSERA